MAQKSTTWVGLLFAGSALWASHADAVTLADGNFITFGAYTVTVNDCAAAQSSSMQMTALASNDGFVISPTGPGPLLYASGSLADVSVTFEVQTTTAILSQVVLQVAGGATGAGVAQVDETAFDSGLTGIGGGTAPAGGSAKLISFSNGPYNDIYLTKDISADASSGGTATINSVTQTFTVPEPTGLSVHPRSVRVC